MMELGMRAGARAGWWAAGDGSLMNDVPRVWVGLVEGTQPAGSCDPT